MGMNLRESNEFEISPSSKQSKNGYHARGDTPKQQSKKSVTILEAFESKKESTLSSNSRKSLSLGKVLIQVD
tara:strand:+ start:434 stop:649 length:216 start_codon:yes stop_codon:yes gene_type:complete